MNSQDRTSKKKVPGARIETLLQSIQEQHLERTIVERTFTLQLTGRTLSGQLPSPRRISCWSRWIFPDRNCLDCPFSIWAGTMETSKVQHGKSVKRKERWEERLQRDQNHYSSSPCTSWCGGDSRRFGNYGVNLTLGKKEGRCCFTDLSLIIRIYFKWQK